MLPSYLAVAPSCRPSLDTEGWALAGLAYARHHLPPTCGSGQELEGPPAQQHPLITATANRHTIWQPRCIEQMRSAAHGPPSTCVPGPHLLLHTIAFPTISDAPPRSQYASSDGADPMCRTKPRHSQTLKVATPVLSVWNGPAMDTDQRTERAHRTFLFMWAPSAWHSPTVVVLLPSPKGVGEIPATTTGGGRTSIIKWRGFRCCMPWDLPYFPLGAACSLSLTESFTLERH
jgi:hypothetical protein